MDHQAALGQHRKWRRRKVQLHMPIAAQLIVDESLEGESAWLSRDLPKELYPAVEPDSDGTRNTPDKLYIALSVPIIASSAWLIIPSARLGSSPQMDNQSTTVYVSPQSRTFQALERLMRRNSYDNRNISIPRRIDALLLDIHPLPLSTVFVGIDFEELGKLRTVYEKYGGGFHSPVKANLKEKKKKNALKRSHTELKYFPLEESDYKDAVRQALSKADILRLHDRLTLPVPSHPITHATPPPAHIIGCEPVMQGVSGPDTNIILVGLDGSTFRLPKSGKKPPKSLTNVATELSEENSTDQYFSAFDEKELPSLGTNKNKLVSLRSTVGEEDDSSSLSDDTDDLISVPGPYTVNYDSLPPNASGTVTPGSIVSNMTASTIGRNQARRKGKVFSASGLCGRVPDGILRPQPREDEDEEANIYVDIKMLVRIGCFSGDLVSVCASSDTHNLQGPREITQKLLNPSETPDKGRIARIFGVPSQYFPSFKHPPPEPKSISYHYQRPLVTPQALLSPILIYNLGSPSNIRISPLPTKFRAPCSAEKRQIYRKDVPSAVPLAAEVTLKKIASPLTTDRQLQPVLFTSLKAYFERRLRVVKSGDLIPVVIKENLGRAIHNTVVDDLDVDGGSLLENLDEYGQPRDIGVAWFRVVTVISKADDGEGISFEEEPHDMAYIDPLLTVMIQAGAETADVPASNRNTWPYYLGLKQPFYSRMSNNQVLACFRSPAKAYRFAVHDQLCQLISAARSDRAIRSELPPLAVLLTSTQRQVGKASCVVDACMDLGLHFFTLDAFDFLGESGNLGHAKVDALLKARIERALSCGSRHTVLMIKHIDFITDDRTMRLISENIKNFRIVIATCTDIEKISSTFRGLFTYELQISAPNDSERENLLKHFVAESNIMLSADVDLSAVAQQTASFVAGDLEEVVQRALLARIKRIEDIGLSVGQSKAVTEVPAVRDVELSASYATLSLKPSDFSAAILSTRKTFADAIGAPNIPNVSWSDVGGLSDIKFSVMETIQLPLERPELFSSGLKKRSGILFYGPPGTGKTLLAKAIATEYNLNFFSVKGPELLNMYIGESEANVRRIFQRARDARPCVIFFDELDSLAPKRGNQGDSGGVMDRIVSQLLAELDGMSNGDGSAATGGIFVIGATNRPDLLDQALLRPGRFDKLLYLGISDTHDKQLKILEALTRKFSLDPALSLQKVASSLPFNYTGADLYALCSDAILKAVSRKTAMIDKNIQQYNSQHEESSLTIAGFFDRVATPEDISVSVTETDFLAARDELIPSVSDQELLHYERVRLAFEGAGDRNQQQVHNGVRDSKTHSGHNGRRRLIIADQNGILTKRNGQPKISSLTGTMAKTDSTALSISDDETDSDTSYAEAEGGPLSDSSDGDSTSAEEAVIEDKSSVGNHLRGRFEHAQKNREKR